MFLLTFQYYIIEGIEYYIWNKENSVNKTVQ